MSELRLGRRAIRTGLAEAVTPKRRSREGGPPLQPSLAWIVSELRLGRRAIRTGLAEAVTPKRRSREGGRFCDSNPEITLQKLPRVHRIRAISLEYLLAQALPMRGLMRGTGKRFVYILRSDTDPARHYVGITSNVDDRLEWHNHGPCGYTVDHRPWSIAVVIEFPTEAEAVRFEQYLKSGSGRAFAKRHFGHGQESA